MFRGLTHCKPFGDMERFRCETVELRARQYARATAAKENTSQNDKIQDGK
jgi:hypothetical protein